MPYLGLVLLLLSVFCLIDTITADDTLVRHLPKVVWIVLEIVLPLAGSIAWLVAGRPVGGGIWGGDDRSSAHRGYQGRSAFPEYNDKPGRAVASDPAADAEFLRQCRARAEEQRRVERDRRRTDGY